jgi:hypothetical protein
MVAARTVVAPIMETECRHKGLMLADLVATLPNYPFQTVSTTVDHQDLLAHAVA